MQHYLNILIMEVFSQQWIIKRDDKNNNGKMQKFINSSKIKHTNPKQK